MANSLCFVSQIPNAFLSLAMRSSPEVNADLPATNTHALPSDLQQTQSFTISERRDLMNTIFGGRHSRESPPSS